MPYSVTMRRAIHWHADVIAGTCAQRVEDQLFDSVPSSIGDLIEQFVHGQQIAIFHGHLHGIAQRATAARDDADLADGVAMRHQRGDKGMPRLVIGNGLAFRRHDRRLGRDHTFDAASKSVSDSIAL